MPLYRIPRDRGRDPRDQIRRGRPARRGLRSELAGPRERGDRHGESALHPEYRSRGPPTLHLKLLRSPHADARIVAIRNEAALATPGVHEIFTWEDVSRRLYTTAIHDHHLADPDDTYMLANVVRFVGQRVAAVVADSEGAAEEGCRRIEVDYEALPAVFDPEEAMQASAPVLHDKTEDPFVRHPERNILLDVHGGVGDVEASFAEADVIHEAEYSAHRVQHAHLETHQTITWLDEQQRLNVRTSSQSPFIAKANLSYLFSLNPVDIRVFCERVGGFGGKQEVLTEDICALATLKSGPSSSSSRARSNSSGAGPPSDAGPGQSRGATRRHANGARDAGRVQIRRLRQPRRRDAVSWLR